MGLLGWFGFLGTVAYICFISFFLGDRIGELRNAELNNIGDFLAGALGALAIFWLILGFFQQGRELRASVEALKLQSEELKNSVQQQSALVAVTEKQLAHETLVREEEVRKVLEAEVPYISLQTAGSSGGKLKTTNFDLNNHGGFAIEIAVSVNTDVVTLSPKQMAAVEQQGTRRITFTSEKALSGYDDLVLRVESIGRNKNKRVQTFAISEPRFPEITNDIEPA